MPASARHLPGLVVAGRNARARASSTALLARSSHVRERFLFEAKNCETLADEKLADRLEAPECRAMETSQPLLGGQGLQVWKFFVLSP